MGTQPRTISKAEALAEAYKRGLLPPDKKAAYEEAQRRGLVGAPAQSPAPAAGPAIPASGMGAMGSRAPADVAAYQGTIPQIKPQTTNPNAPGYFDPLAPAVPNNQNPKSPDFQFNWQRDYPQAQPTPDIPLPAVPEGWTADEWYMDRAAGIERRNAEALRATSNPVVDAIRTGDKWLMDAGQRFAYKLDPQGKVPQFISENVTPAAQKVLGGLGSKLPYGEVMGPMGEAIGGGLSEFAATTARNPVQAATEATDMLEPTHMIARGGNKLVEAGGQAMSGDMAGARQSYLEATPDLLYGTLGVVPFGSATVAGMQRAAQAPRAALQAQAQRALGAADDLPTMPPGAAPAAATQAQPSPPPVAQPPIPQAPRGGAGAPPPVVPPPGTAAAATPPAGPANAVASLGEAEVWFNSLPQKNREAILRTFAASGVENRADQFAIIADLNSLPPGRNSQNYFLIAQKWGEQYPSLRENLFNMGGDFSATNPRAPDQKFLGVFGKGRPDRAQGIMDAEGRKQVVSERKFLERSAEENFGAPSSEVAQQYKDELAGLGKRYNWLLDPTRQRKFQDPEKLAALEKSTKDLQAYLSQPWIVETMPPAVKNRLLTDASKEMRRLGWSPEELKIILAGDDRSILAPLFEAHGPLQWSPDVWKHIVTQYPKFAAHVLQSSYATAARDLARSVTASDNAGTIANLGRMRGMDEAGNVVPGGLLDRLQQTMPNSDFSFVGKGSYADTRVNWGDIKGANEAFDITRRFKAAAQSGENVAAIIDEMDGLSPRAKEAALSEITSFVHDSMGNKVRNITPGQVGRAGETIPNLTAIGNDNFLSALRKVFGQRGDALANDIELARSSTDSMMTINRRIGPNTRIKDENIRTAKNVYEDPAGLDSNVVDSTVKVASMAGAGALATGQFGAAGTLAALAGLQAVWNKVKQGRRLNNTERSLLADFMFRSREAGQNGEALLDAAAASGRKPPSPNLPSRAGYVGNVVAGAAAGGAAGAASSNGDPNAIILGILGGAGVGGARAKQRSARANRSIIKPRPMAPPASAPRALPGQTSNASATVTGALVGGGIGAAANPDDPGKGAVYGALAGGALTGGARKLLGNSLKTGAPRKGPPGSPARVKRIVDMVAVGDKGVVDVARSMPKADVLAAASKIASEGVPGGVKITNVDEAVQIIEDAANFRSFASDVTRTDQGLAPYPELRTAMKSGAGQVVPFTGKPKPPPAPKGGAKPPQSSASASVLVYRAKGDNGNFYTTNPAVARRYSRTGEIETFTLDARDFSEFDAGAAIPNGDAVRSIQSSGAAGGIFRNVADTGSPNGTNTIWSPKGSEDLTRVNDTQYYVTDRSRLSPAKGGAKPPVASPPPFKPVEGAEVIDTSAMTPAEISGMQKELNALMQERRTASGARLAEIDRDITSIRNALEMDGGNPAFNDVPVTSRFNAPVDIPWKKGSPESLAIEKAIAGKRWKVEAVPLSKVIPTQDSVFYDYAKAATRYAGDERYPLVVKQGDQYFVADGHHRMMAQAGGDQVRARVVDLSTAPPKPPAQAGFARELGAGGAAGLATAIAGPRDINGDGVIDEQERASHSMSVLSNAAIAGGVTRFARTALGKSRGVKPPPGPKPPASMGFGGDGTTRIRGMQDGGQRVSLFKTQQGDDFSANLYVADDGGIALHPNYPNETMPALANALKQATQKPQNPLLTNPTRELMKLAGGNKMRVVEGGKKADGANWAEANLPLMGPDDLAKIGPAVLDRMAGVVRSNPDAPRYVLELGQGIDLSQARRSMRALAREKDMVYAEAKGGEEIILMDRAFYNNNRPRYRDFDVSYADPSSPPLQAGFGGGKGPPKEPRKPLPPPKRSAIKDAAGRAAVGAAVGTAISATDALAQSAEMTNEFLVPLEEERKRIRELEAELNIILHGTVEEKQAYLAETRGLKVSASGEPDGRLGPDTRAAIVKARTDLEAALAAARDRENALAGKAETRRVAIEQQMAFERTNPSDAQQAFRDWAPLVGATVGAVGAKSARLLGVGLSKPGARSAIAKSDALLSGKSSIPASVKPAEINKRASNLNEFWQRGGATSSPTLREKVGLPPPKGAPPNGVPFETSPKTGDWKARPSTKVTPPQNLFPDKFIGSRLRSGDVLIGGTGVIESYLADQHAQKVKVQLEEARLIARDDPSEKNLARVQSLEDQYATAKAWSAVGAGVAAGTILGLGTSKYASRRANVPQAERELAQLRRYLASQGTPVPPTKPMPPPNPRRASPKSTPPKKRS